MNNKELQAKVKTIENLITQTKSTLTLWTKNIETYQQQLQQLTNQLNTIKKQLTK